MSPKHGISADFRSSHAMRAIETSQSSFSLGPFSSLGLLWKVHS
jgi:hypothetical protein